MPTKYTFEQVKNKFDENNCILLDTQYINQLHILKYISSCGHENTKSFKEFLNGTGIKCRNCALEIPTYEEVVKIFQDKNCIVKMTKEEFSEKYQNSTCKINYNAVCGHENMVSLKNFKTLNQGISCPLCVNKNTGIKLKNLKEGDNKLSGIKQEYNCIKYFTKLVDDSFDIIKTFDGCKADISLKPKNKSEDLWLGIQVKTTLKKTEREQYYFRLNSGKYDNCLILCICEEEKKIWLIPYDDVEGFKTIGIALKSKYNKYEVNNDNLIEMLNYYYEKLNKFSFDILDTPISISNKQEKEYRKMRETKLDFIKFIGNDMEGLVYDFKIGEKKIQEKVGSITHNNKNSYSFNLNKQSGIIDKKIITCCYDEEDNDFYWLNCKNGLFYVIPTNILVENGFVGKDATRKKIYLSPTNTNTEWCNKYLFDYNNVDKERLLELLYM